MKKSTEYYLYNRQIKECCNHTHDISHAKNFSKLRSTNSYIEIEKE